MAEHGALFQGRLDGVGLREGVVGGAALHNDGDIGLDVVDGDLAVPGAQLLLGGQHSDDVAGQLLSLQPPQGFQQGGAADAAVEALAEEQLVIFVVVELGGGNNGFADADAEILHCVFIGNGTHIDDHVGDIRSVGRSLFRGGHEVDRLGGDDAGDIGPIGGADQHLAGDQGILVPAAQRQKAQAAVGLDGMDDEAHFVGMGVDHHHRLGAGVFLAVDVQVAQEILLQLSDGRGIFPGHGHHFLFKAGSTGGIGQFLQHTDHIGIVSHENPSFFSIA